MTILLAQVRWKQAPQGPNPQKNFLYTYTWSLDTDPNNYYNAPMIYLGDALDHYSQWPTPTVIISDGAYGLGLFPGDPKSPAGSEEGTRRQRAGLGKADDYDGATGLRGQVLAARGGRDRVRAGGCCADEVETAVERSR